MQETVEVRIVREDLRADEVQQREELLHVVLQRCARDEQPTAGQERAHDLGEDRVDVLDTVGLVDHDVLKRKPTKGALFNQTYFVGRDADLEVTVNESVVDYLCSLLLRTCKDGNIEIRRPLLKFSSPILQCRLWYND